ncbi:isochorismate synthase [Bizionia gelidisalsuginis]|uniref:Isochorismate synthase n=1 Tax=Bizionia gelidisalsuginis TaxID=291188 RepID=A0ABY3MC01_9FLAO|nr:chorismate-binding protein [Bizionia gelidisalsuginis]TYC14846.1 isochorismate synthase [Bizionia gelidisalsuginis]
MTFSSLLNSAEVYFNDALPFVIYREPNATNVKGLFQNNDTVYNTIDYSERGFVFAPFDTIEKSILIPFDNSEFYAVPVAYAEVSLNTTISDSTTKIDKEVHINRVKKAIGAMQSGALQKVVISRKERVDVKAADFISIYKRLLNNYKTAFVYCWYHPKVGMWLGATPETLLKTQGNRFTTMSLAGTQKYEGTEAVEWQAKEKEEQHIVTQFITSNLEAVSNNLKVSELQTVRAGGVLHLKTEISGSANTRFLDLHAVLNALHPTPAVCGVPKLLAKRFILDNENYNREFYAGFLGELNYQEKTNRNPKLRNVENSAYGTVKTVSNVYVNLRCMQLKESEGFIYVGGGITARSNPELEWEETINKSKTIKNSL